MISTSAILTSWRTSYEEATTTTPEDSWSPISISSIVPFRISAAVNRMAWPLTRADKKNLSSKTKPNRCKVAIWLFQECFISTETEEAWTSTGSLGLERATMEQIILYQGLWPKTSWIMKVKEVVALDWLIATASECSVIPFWDHKQSTEDRKTSVKINRLVVYMITMSIFLQHESRTWETTTRTQSKKTSSTWTF